MSPSRPGAAIVLSQADRLACRPGRSLLGHAMLPSGSQEYDASSLRPLRLVKKVRHAEIAKTAFLALEPSSV
ncbi:hypothetical protein K456DRAFT_50601 [Colletotrichum gloeosporioides 23]|nr:hypothetical protein K456DRAFT_50601 [Colletotrichum gloeosporioides 23]